MKAAFFDVTGTLLQENTIPKYLHFLAEHGVFNARQLAAMHRIHSEHKKHHLTELETTQKLVSLIVSSLKGTQVRKFKALNQLFLQSEHANFYPYTKKLLSILKKKHFRLVAVSGAFQDVVEPFTESLGFAAAYGTRLKTKNGRFTGRIVHNLTDPAQKKWAVLTYAHHHGIDLHESLCFGDMVLDEQMMEQVGLPIALNAGPGLKRACRKNGWLSLTHENLFQGLSKALNQKI
ncbi:HAD family phosphatase [Candidatus Micrarchaeota archaeon]|nr:HAD family phosphatase [Candidatus Micrarchaeota archaeon]